MKYYVNKILLANGWAAHKTLTIVNGTITQITDGKDATIDETLGTVIPGMINCHSHAFQRAFAGFSEQGSEGQNSFWTWRKVMYQFLAKLTDTDAQIIATQLYIEMLKMGYTRVAEFHYLHHNIDGQVYDKTNHQHGLATMAYAIFSAANTAGIGLTMLPVLYQYADFGKQTANKEQKRFINSIDQFNQLVNDCFVLSKQFSNTNMGIAPHSLRAVDKSAIIETSQHVRSLDKNAPIHIHISEQQKEVDDCLNYYGKRPVQWLLENINIDKRWCLIHATHINNEEQKALVQSQAVVGICPTTEANLGDGIFPTAPFLDLKGTIAIGSDSHISVNPIEELRWLEYAQRLSKQQRAILACLQSPSVGQNLWQKAASGGAQSTNSNTGCLAVGKQADLLVLDDQQTRLYANNQQQLLDSLIFASRENTIKDVMVNGQWVVRNGIHPQQESSTELFAKLLVKLSK